MKKLSRTVFLAASFIAATAHNASAQVVDNTKAGDLQISGAKMVYKKDHLDIFLTIKNTSKFDEKLGGADTPVANDGVVLVTEQDGKEVEAPGGTILTAGKETEFSKDHVWLRIQGIREPRDTDVIPVSLFFRRSPNAHLALALDADKAAKHPTTDTAAALPVDDIHKLTPFVTAPPAPPTPAPVGTPAPTPVSSSTPNGTTTPVPPTTPAPAPQAPQKSSSFLDWFKK